MSCDYIWKLSFSQNGISLVLPVIFTCNRFIPPEQVEKINLSLKKSIEVHFSRSKIFLLYFYDAYDVNLWEKKETNVLLMEFHHFMKKG